MPVTACICYLYTLQGTHCTMKTGKLAKQYPSLGIQGIWKFCQNTGKTENLVCSSCKFTDSKGTIYFNMFCKHIVLKLNKSAKIVLCM